MEAIRDRVRLDERVDGTPRYQQVAAAVEAAISSGVYPPGARLPTVRQLAAEVGVSLTTAVAAYNRLRDLGWIRGEVGRGTFVADRTNEPLVERWTGSPRQAGRSPVPTELTLANAVPWRRRALTTSAARLRNAYPDAVDCTSGRPDPQLLPLSVLQRAFAAALATTSHADLQYSGPDPIHAFTRSILPRLAADGVPAVASDLVVGASAQQFMVLALESVVRTAGVTRPVVAVEEPGYPTIFDTYERAGYELVGVTVDESGAMPSSLAAALSAGVDAVLLTPRAHNPTGASWTPARAAVLADILADYPEVLVIEDDQFAGIARTRPGSLIADRRIEERVVYIRSFAKSVAPDLRVAVAVARGERRRQLADAKAFADGWTSRIAQRALAFALEDPELDAALEIARDAYTARRMAAATAFTAELAGFGGSASVGDDGVNVWVTLPPGIDAAAVVEQVAKLGVLVAPGEPFFLRPGRHDVIRVNAGSVSVETAAEAGRALAAAARGTASADSDSFAV